MRAFFIFDGPAEERAHRSKDDGACFGRGQSSGRCGFLSGMVRDDCLFAWGLGSLGDGAHVGLLEEGVPLPSLWLLGLDWARGV